MRLDLNSEEMAWQLGDEGLPPLRDEVEPPDDEPLAPRKIQTGAEFILSPDANPEPIWGKGDEILWAAGEPLLIAASPGAGKTTIAQQVALARIRGEDVLDFPVQSSRARVLYIAADRPRQSARSWQRMVSEDDAVLLGSQVRVVTEACLRDVVSLAEEAEAETVFIDTLGAVAREIETSSGGQLVYEQLQAIVHAGLEVCILHHTRKQGAERKPLHLDDIFGSQWIGAVVGSALLIEKQSRNKGFLRQEKEPAERVFLKLHHDHAKGKTHAEQWSPDDPAPTHENLPEPLSQPDRMGVELFDYT